MRDFTPTQQSSADLDRAVVGERVVATLVKLLLEPSPAAEAPGLFLCSLNCLRETIPCLAKEGERSSPDSSPTQCGHVSLDSMTFFAGLACAAPLLEDPDELVMWPSPFVRVRAGSRSAISNGFRPNHQAKEA